MASDLRDVPEFQEGDLGESLISRTESLSSFRELGPPDLVHIIKTTARSGARDIGSYHYVSGIDASSSASLAAYINSLNYAVEEAPGWFGTKGGKTDWKIRSGCFCSFNSFARCDVRVEVKIPGGVDAYCIDLRGERHECTPQTWTEVYLSSVLRAILYTDDVNYRIAGYRKLDPIQTPDDEMRFLQAAEQCFPRGWQLGSDPEIQVATTVSNHLTAGIMKYFGDAGRYSEAINLFERMSAKDGEVAALLAKCYIGMNEEVKAIQVLHRAVRNHPTSYPLLHVQCDFLRKKGKYDWAFDLAKQAVNTAPSEFVTWSKLTQVNIELQKYTDVLLTLNSCPMFTYSERDLHRMPTPAKTHLPVKQYINDSGILDEDSARDNEADIALLRLPAPSLRGTFAKAYELLTLLVSRIGWDELLKCRSQVFVMEEEYRMQKQQEEMLASSSVLRFPGTESKINGTKSEDSEDNASTRALKTPVNDSTKDEDETIPEIRISSDQDSDSKEAVPAADMPTKPTESHTHSAQPDSAAAAPQTPVATPDPDKKSASFSPGGTFNNKRLCERWLDNLFMVLYEDLRVYTIFKAEMAHFKAQHLPYRKTGTEWEILGDLAERLQHREEAKECYQRCLDTKFSAKAWLKLLEIYANEGDVQRALNASIRLATYQHRWYMESAYPSAVAQHLYKLIRREGISKISYSLVSMNLPQPILKTCMQPIFQYAQTFKVEGTETTS